MSGSFTSGSSSRRRRANAKSIADIPEASRKQRAAWRRTANAKAKGRGRAAARRRR